MGPSHVGDRLVLKACVNRTFENSLEIGVRVGTLDLLFFSFPYFCISDHLDYFYFSYLFYFFFFYSFFFASFLIFIEAIKAPTSIQPEPIQVTLINSGYLTYVPVKEKNQSLPRSTSFSIVCPIST